MVSYGFGKSKKTCRSQMQPTYVPSEKGDQPWNGIGGTQIGRGINLGCLPRAKSSAPPPFTPTAYIDKRSKRLDGNSQTKSFGVGMTID